MRRWKKKDRKVEGYSTWVWKIKFSLLNIRVENLGYLNIDKTVSRRQTNEKIDITNTKNIITRNKIRTELFLFEKNNKITNKSIYSHTPLFRHTRENNEWKTITFEINRLIIHTRLLSTYNLPYNLNGNNLGTQDPPGQFCSRIESRYPIGIHTRIDEF